LHNIKPAEAYGQDHIYMVTVNGNSPAYDRIVELNFTDGDGTPIIILCYVQVQSIKGYDDFVLISNDTLDDIQTDINYHSSMSRHVGIVPLRRLVKQPYHYSDTSKRSPPKSDATRSLKNKAVLLMIIKRQCLPLKQRRIRHHALRHVNVHVKRG
jgi:hypothetical protein